MITKPNEESIELDVDAPIEELQRDPAWSVWVRGQPSCESCYFTHPSVGLLFDLTLVHVNRTKDLFGFCTYSSSFGLPPKDCKRLFEACARIGPASLEKQARANIAKLNTYLKTVKKRS